MYKEGDVRCSEQNTVEVDPIVIDPVLHRWDEAQELQGTESTSARAPIDACRSCIDCVGQRSTMHLNISDTAVSSRTLQSLGIADAILNNAKQGHTNSSGKVTAYRDYKDAMPEERALQRVKQAVISKRASAR